MLNVAAPEPAGVSSANSSQEPKKPLTAPSNPVEATVAVVGVTVREGRGPRPSCFSGVLGFLSTLAPLGVIGVWKIGF